MFGNGLDLCRMFQNLVKQFPLVQHLFLNTINYLLLFRAQLQNNIVDSFHCIPSAVNLIQIGLCLFSQQSDKHKPAWVYRQFYLPIDFTQCLTITELLPLVFDLAPMSSPLSNCYTNWYQRNQSDPKVAIKLLL